jgi:hypothetical protein
MVRQAEAAGDRARIAKNSLINKGLSAYLHSICRRIYDQISKHDWGEVAACFFPLIPDYSSNGSGPRPSLVALESA